MSKPISPSQVQAIKNSKIPDEVLEAFNQMIAENWDGTSSRFTQDDVVGLTMTKFKEARKRFTREHCFSKHWFNVEPLYQAEGWKVTYDKPGFCEDYDAYFIFRK